MRSAGGAVTPTLKTTSPNDGVQEGKHQTSLPMDFRESLPKNGSTLEYANKKPPVNQHSMENGK